MLNSKIDKLKLYYSLIFLVQIAVVLLFEFVFKLDYTFLLYIYMLIFVIETTYFFIFYEIEKKKRTTDVNRVLGNEAKEAFEYGKVGVIVYDDAFEIAWVNDFVLKEFADIMGKKITEVFEDSELIIKGVYKEVTVNVADKVYQLTKCDDDQALLIKDVTAYTQLKQCYDNQQVVLGLINLDNYSETIQNEDEQRIAQINTDIRQKVIQWVVDCGGLVRRIRSDRLFVVLDKQHFDAMIKSRFDILQQVKQSAKDLLVDITCSMSFVYDYLEYGQADEALNKYLELVLSRGGDQVAVKQNEKEVVFYGTSSEATEKVSKVRARVMASSLEKLIRGSSNVIVVGHKDADLDCLGALIAVSKIAGSCDKTSYLIFNDVSIEPVCQSIFNDNILALMEDHIFVSEKEALALLDDDSLVVVVDHHSIDLTSAVKLVSTAKQIAIIDHHRKKSEDNVAALMIYNEPSASSTVELLCELIQYQSNEIHLTQLESSIMYAGLLVDTDKLKSRCSFRTFEACAYLKKQRADTALANDWLKEDLQDFINKSNITKSMMILSGNIVVSAVNPASGNMSRTSLAQGANYICGFKDVEAAFVIAQTDNNTVSVSARSNGKVNVQLIMEKLGGGGHFNAAGLQKPNTTVVSMKEQLLNAIAQYQQEGVSEDEGNSVEGR
ncbi:MAG: DHH family phosphoesterase [Erysipelotrichaceae bacterium]